MIGTLTAALSLVLFAGSVMAMASAGILSRAFRHGGGTHGEEPNPVLAMSVINLLMAGAWVLAAGWLFGLPAACLFAAAVLVILALSPLRRVFERLASRHGAERLGRLSLGLDALTAMLAAGLYAASATL